MNTVSPVLLVRWTTPGNLVAMIDGDRQDVMIAADGGVGIAEDLAQLRIAEQPANLVLHALVDIGRVSGGLGQLRAGHVEHVAAAVDAAADRLGHRPQVFDGASRSERC